MGLFFNFQNVPPLGLGKGVKKIRMSDTPPKDTSPLKDTPSVSASSSPETSPLLWAPKITGTKRIPQNADSPRNTQAAKTQVRLRGRRLHLEWHGRPKPNLPASPASTICSPMPSFTSPPSNPPSRAAVLQSYREASVSCLDNSFERARKSQKTQTEAHQDQCPLNFLLHDLGIKPLEADEDHLNDHLLALTDNASFCSPRPSPLKISQDVPCPSSPTPQILYTLTEEELRFLDIPPASVSEAPSHGSPPTLYPMTLDVVTSNASIPGTVLAEASTADSHARSDVDLSSTSNPKPVSGLEAFCRRTFDNAIYKTATKQEVLQEAMAVAARSSQARPKTEKNM